MTMKLSDVAFGLLGCVIIYGLVSAATAPPEGCRERAETSNGPTIMICDAGQTVEVSEDRKLIVCRCPKDAPPEAGR